MRYMLWQQLLPIIKVRLWKILGNNTSQHQKRVDWNKRADWGDTTTSTHIIIWYRCSCVVERVYRTALYSLPGLCCRSFCGSGVISLPGLVRGEGMDVFSLHAIARMELVCVVYVLARNPFFFFFLDCICYLVGHFWRPIFPLPHPLDIALLNLWFMYNTINLEHIYIAWSIYMCTSCYLYWS